MVEIFAYPVLDGIYMFTFRELLGIGDHDLARLRGGLSLIQGILYLYVTDPEIAARYCEFHTLQLIRNVYAYLLLYGVCVILAHSSRQIIFCNFKRSALYSFGTGRCSLV